MHRQHLIEWDDPRLSAEKARHLGGLDFLHQIMSGDIAPPPVAQLLGLELTQVEAGCVTFKMKIEEFHYNPIGTVHGGIISTLLDSALGCAVQSNLPPGGLYTTTQLNVNLVRALLVDVGEVWCTATVVHGGRRLATAEAKVYDRHGKLYAHGTTNCFVLMPNGS